MVFYLAWDCCLTWLQKRRDLRKNKCDILWNLWQFVTFLERLWHSWKGCDIRRKFVTFCDIMRYFETFSDKDFNILFQELYWPLPSVVIVSKKYFYYHQVSFFWNFPMTSSPYFFLHFSCNFVNNKKWKYSPKRVTLSPYLQSSSSKL